MNNVKKNILNTVLLGICTFSASVAFAELVSVTEENGILIANFQTSYEGSESELDYANARAMPMLSIQGAFGYLGGEVTYPGPAGSEPGSSGTGEAKSITVPSSEMPNNSFGDVAPMEYGNTQHTFTTSRVDTQGWLSKKLPYRKAGKLYFKVGSDTSMCSASLVKPGILVTAAHCVIEFGSIDGWFSNWEYHPARYGKKVYNGKWKGEAVAVISSYANGTDNCADYGIVCENDVAVIKLKAKKQGTHIGHKTGWYGYGWNGYGYTKNPFAIPKSGTQITQLGYPVSHDQGLKMQRTDSFGYVDTELSNNTIIGSRQTGGSSGGPWIVNLGQKASGTNCVSACERDIVVGVASWGSVSDLPKQQGASPFTSNNIVKLVDSFCQPPVEPHCQ